MSIGNITSGFRATGICPYDKDVLPTEAFAPSLATEKPYQETTAAADDSEYDSDDYLPLGELRKKLIPLNNSFAEVLPTPDLVEKKSAPRRKAIKYKAVGQAIRIFKGGGVST
ncbi:unnamed protein product [Acanthoscelides obtectus]|uniref:Uncharacterized protein n=1 Tax=Acanthoscelides obtectus TaxID=200917 RepID=A0A9P0JPF7_ACAOB|nr:unnamed protein product [Acanthoscelides obtectus]CAK1671177.1 hypothetical protein AOBTE_LOCUS28114 [Acanthoscelides obtectus]